MATALIDGIVTHYETVGSGPPLLMLSPGGFEATLEKWRTLGVYARTRPLEHLARQFTCIVFDRRECGESGGRVEAIGWKHYAAHAKALLDHLGIARAHVMGGCMGCAVATAFAVAYPAATQCVILWWPVGGARYRIRGRQRFADHLTYVHAQGLEDVVALVEAEGKSFGADPRGGPWASVIGHDRAFADAYAKLDRERYAATVTAMMNQLHDRDTAPGAEAEDLMRLRVPALIVPGRDESHATSAARYLEECLEGAEYWDVPVDAQTEAGSAERLSTFLMAHA